MKLLDEKLVEEAAKEYFENENENGDTYSSVGEYLTKINFKVGVSFAEQQLKEKMIEFTEWCIDNHCRNNDNTWGAMDSKTTEQLLKQFLNNE